MIKDILKLLKINHYIKNLIVFFPLLLSRNILNFDFCVKSLIMFIAFCLISSAVYVLNDIIDIQHDKNHPVKCNRPIASGRISKAFAIIILIILLTASLFVVNILNNLCIIAIVSYFVLNIFYSFFLKKFVLIDASCIAIGFILRIVGGCFAIGILPSPLVILMTFFVSNFFTYTKRYLELQFSKYDTRKSLKEFNISTANQFRLINAILSISFYITYVLDKTTIQRAGSEYLYLTVILFTLIIYRLFLLTSSATISDDPIIYIEQDKTIKWLALIYFVLLFVVLTILK